MEWLQKWLNWTNLATLQLEQDTDYIQSFNKGELVNAPSKFGILIFLFAAYGCGGGGDGSDKASAASSAKETSKAVENATTSTPKTSSAEAPPAPSFDASYVRGGLGRTGFLDREPVTELNELLWTVKTKKPVKSSPVASGGYVFFGSDDDFFYAVDGKTGQVQWRLGTKGDIAGGAPPTKIPYFWVCDRNVYAVEAASGLTKWRFRTKGAVVSWPVVHAKRNSFS